MFLHNLMLKEFVVIFFASCRSLKKIVQFYASGLWLGGSVSNEMKLNWEIDGKMLFCKLSIVLKAGP